MARRSSTTSAATVADEQPGAEVAAQSEPQVTIALGDVEAWVAAVYDHQHNGGPKPVRKYRPPLPTPVG